MYPINFPEANKTLVAPVGQPDVGPLRVWSDNQEVISCWTAPWRERLRFLVHGRLWLRVMSGYTAPPVAVEISRGGPFMPALTADQAQLFREKVLACAIAARRAATSFTDLVGGRAE